MLIQQITNFELRGPWPPGRTCTSTAGCFYDKTKISKENLRLDLLLKYCRRQRTLLLSTWAKLLANFNPKCELLNVLRT